MGINGAPFHAIEIYGRVQKGHRKTNTADRHRINKLTAVDVSRREVPHQKQQTDRRDEHKQTCDSLSYDCQGR